MRRCCDERSYFSDIKNELLDNIKPPDLADQIFFIYLPLSDICEHSVFNHGIFTFIYCGTKAWCMMVGVPHPFVVSFIAIIWHTSSACPTQIIRCCCWWCLPTISYDRTNRGVLSTIALWVPRHQKLTLMNGCELDPLFIPCMPLQQKRHHCVFPTTRIAVRYFCCRSCYGYHLMLWIFW